MNLTWEELRESLDISEDEECLIEIEKDLIRTMVEIREKKGLTQAPLGYTLRIMPLEKKKH